MTWVTHSDHTRLSIPHLTNVTMNIPPYRDDGALIGLEVARGTLCFLTVANKFLNVLSYCCENMMPPRNLNSRQSGLHLQLKAGIPFSARKVTTIWRSCICKGSLGYGKSLRDTCRCRTSAHFSESPVADDRLNVSSATMSHVWTIPWMQEEK
jgi:hypothetical protein